MANVKKFVQQLGFIWSLSEDSTHITIENWYDHTRMPCPMKLMQSLTLMGGVLINYREDTDISYGHKDDLVLYEVGIEPEGKTPVILWWAHWDEWIVKQMIQDHVRRHDKCSCGHLFSEHDWATGRCLLCKCSEDKEDLDHQTTPVNYECPNCGAQMNGNEAVQECPRCGYGTEAWDHRNDDDEPRVVSTQDTPGGFTICQ